MASTEPTGRVMTIERFAALVDAGDTAAVKQALAGSPQLLTGQVVRDDVTGWSPLHLAVRAGHGDLVTALIAAGADLCARTEHGRTPLHVSLQFDSRFRQQLLDAGAPVDVEVAAYFDDVALLSEQLAHDPSSATAAPTGMPPLYWAAYGRAVGATRLLLERGATADGGALHAAADVNGAEVAQVLIDAGADPSEPDVETGETALHAAARHRWTDDNTAVARVLLAAGADVDAVSSDGVSALDIARIGRARQLGESNGGGTAYEAMIELLLQSGARD